MVTYCYALTGNAENAQMGGGIDQIGSLKTEITFSTALTSQVTAIILSQSSALLSITKHREVEVINQGII